MSSFMTSFAHSANGAVVPDITHGKQSFIVQSPGLIPASLGLIDESAPKKLEVSR
jgi:hypothetical protein